MLHKKKKLVFQKKTCGRSDKQCHWQDCMSAALKFGWCVAKSPARQGNETNKKQYIMHACMTDCFKDNK